MNSYGFAAGDPINFSDPFGLCKPKDVNCRNLVRMLREQGGSAFNAAAATYDAYQGGNVSFYAESQMHPLTPRGSLDGWVNTETGNVGLLGERSREDFLIAAVHEAWHLNNFDKGNVHPSELVDVVYQAYMQLSPEERKRATQAANWLYENTNGERGEPKDKTEKP
jgi:hypothetical protein